jgi:hypothetical protein
VVHENFIRFVLLIQFVDDIKWGQVDVVLGLVVMSGLVFFIEKNRSGSALVADQWHELNYDKNTMLKRVEEDLL